MRIKDKLAKITATILTASILIGISPMSTAVTAYAAQSNDYVDPADSWLETNNRTNELDANATVTSGTLWCFVCNKETLTVSYRVPEYTRTGETALNRGVGYSDGTCFDGKSHGNLDNGRPGINAYYTGSHWTKTICQICGTLNPSDNVSDYNFNRNVYALNPCDNNFFLDFDNTAYTPYDASYHTTLLKAGKYCQFCKGTKAQATLKKEYHNFSETVDGQIGNNRFFISETCGDCGYSTSEYVAAKSVVSSYYGTADGDAHTVSVSDLSDSGVHTKIRYGKTASDCYMTSAPNYTKVGYYPVYYEI